MSLKMQDILFQLLGCAVSLHDIVDNGSQLPIRFSNNCFINILPALCTIVHLYKLLTRSSAVLLLPSIYYVTDSPRSLSLLAVPELSTISEIKLNVSFCFYFPQNTFTIHGIFNILSEPATIYFKILDKNPKNLRYYWS